MGGVACGRSRVSTRGFDAVDGAECADVTFTSRAIPSAGGQFPCLASRVCGRGVRGIFTF
jgi:hypothetical protein